MTGYLYIAATIALTVYGQIIIKWQVSKAGAMPPAPVEKVWFLGSLLLNPWVMSGFAAAFLASLFWMAALSRFPLSYAYPFMSLSFVGVLLLSATVFAESITLAKALGMVLLVLGLVIGSQKW